MNKSSVPVPPREKVTPIWPHKVLSEAIDKAIPASTITRVLEENDATGQRDRYLSGRVTVLFVLAMCLWPTVGMRDCLRNLIEGCRQGWRRLLENVPVKSAICAARTRLGVRPLTALFRAVARPLATVNTKGAFYKGMRMVAFDGTQLNVPDTKQNDHFFGRPTGNRGSGAFPQARMVWLMEVATRAAIDFIAVPYHVAEQTVVWRLLRSLREGMLVLWDRGFHSYDLWKALRTTNAHLLARVKNWLILCPLQSLSDGSFLARIYPNTSSRRKDSQGILVRVIEYTIKDPHRPGHSQKHRLLTSLLDHLRYPAQELICLYHERWEIEMGLDEIKVHQNENRLVIRSKTPRGVIQEIHGLMLLHFCLCHLRHEAALTIDIDPDRISFVHTLRVLRRAVPSFQKAPAHRLPLMYAQMLCEITQEILPQRRIRCYPRVLKRRIGTFPVKRPSHKSCPQPTKPFSDIIEVLK